MPEPLSPRQQLARAALLEITGAETIGEPSGEVDEGDGVMSYLFDTRLTGYPGWKWTVTVAQVEGSEPTVLEAELMPADGALLAPDWVPWSERMDDYRAAQLALGEPASEGIDDLDTADAIEVLEDLEDDDDLNDDDDDGDFRPSTLHAGDLDGVDIDELDVPPVGVDEPDDAEAEPDGARVEPPAVPARRKRARKSKQDDEGE